MNFNFFFFVCARFSLKDLKTYEVNPMMIIFDLGAGHPALIGRHRPFPVTHRAAERWLNHMQQALDTITDIDPDSKIKMMNFFRYKCPLSHFHFTP